MAMTSPSVTLPEPASPAGRAPAPAPPASGWAGRTGALALLALAVAMALFMSQVSGILSAQPTAPPTPVNRLRAGGDSYVHWFALQALRTGDDPYGAAVAAATQHAVWGVERDPHLQAFVYPLPSLGWYLPSLWLDLEAHAWYARLLGLVGLVASVPLTLRLLRQPLRGWPLLAGAGLLASMAAPWDQLALGQNVSVALALALAAALLYRAERYGLAGLALALALVKPHHVLVLAGGLALHAAAARRRWPFLAALGLAAGAELAVSLLVAPGWIGRWLARAVDHAGWFTGYLEVLVGSQPVMLWLVRALVVAPVLALWWRHRRDAARDDWWALAVAGALVSSMVALTATNSSLYNLVPIWPALALLLFERRPGPAGPIARLVRALNQGLVVLLPAAGGVLALAWLLLPAMDGSTMALLATLVVWLSLYQGLAAALGVLEHSRHHFSCHWFTVRDAR
jgi:hypothetical protein